MIWSLREIWSRLCHRSLQLRWGCSCHHTRHVTSHHTSRYIASHYITLQYILVVLCPILCHGSEICFFLLSFDSFFPQDLQTTAEFPAHMEELRAVLLKVCLECDRFTSSSPLLSSPLLSSPLLSVLHPFLSFSLPLRWMNFMQSARNWQQKWRTIRTSYEAWWCEQRMPDWWETCKNRFYDPFFNVVCGDVYS